MSASKPLMAFGFQQLNMRKLAGTISNNVVLLPKLPGIMMVPGGPQHPSLYDAGRLMSVSMHHPCKHEHGQQNLLCQCSDMAGPLQTSTLSRPASSARLPSPATQSQQSVEASRLPTSCLGTRPTQVCSDVAAVGHVGMGALPATESVAVALVGCCFMHHGASESAEFLQCAGAYANHNTLSITNNVLNGSSFVPLLVGLHHRVALSFDLR